MSSPASSSRPKPWNPADTKILIRAYFGMLEAQNSGAPYVKAHFNQEVQLETGRSKGSIEYKFCNISAVLHERGLPYVAGYRPRGHYQKSLADDVLRFIRFASAKDGRGEKVLSETDESLWETSAKLWNRATGGTNVAAKPGDDVSGIWPSAPAPAGVDDACRWLKEGFSTPSEPRLLFLVGGPGAGKSHASALVTEDLKASVNEAAGPAQRAYEYDFGQGRLLVINDATIANSTTKTSLGDDISDVLETHSYLLACVNRGILVEEGAEFTRRGSPELASGGVLISWLNGKEASESSSLGNPDAWHIEDESECPFLKTGGIFLGSERKASICVVYVDVCSLFELQPSYQSRDSDPVLHANNFGRYTPSLLAERWNLDLNKIPAAILLKSVVDKFDSGKESVDGGGFINPISANIQSLRSARAISGIMTLARSAEVVISSRMTYREVWGLFSRLIIGDAPSFLPREDLKKWVLENQPQGASAKGDFDSVRRLARLRFSQSIFGAVDGQEDPRQDAVLRFMSMIDPVRDVTPGYAQNSMEGWATPVLDAFEVDSFDSSPLKTLIERDQTGSLKDIVSEFDYQVDSIYRSLLTSEVLLQKDRQEAISWYSAYLTRLFASSLGIPAFRMQIHLWLLTRNRVGRALPDELKSMMTLIRPRRFPEAADSPSLVPVYNSRTEPIIGQVEQSRLAVRYGNLHLETSLQGEDILLHLIDDGQRIGSVYLDFALIREAMACSEGHLGITDLIDSTSPRLERIRASRLIGKRLSDAEFTIVTQNTDIQLTLVGQ